MGYSKSNNINRKSVISAAIVAIFLLFLFGLSHRIIAEKMLFSDGMSSIDPNVLAEFPIEIGLWTGREMPLDEVIIEATGTDAHISRNYVRNGGLDSVALYVAFGQKARDLMPHRPEVCYVGAGWRRESIETEEFTLADGTKLPCTILQFSKGSLVKNKIMILDYYIVDGILCSDISLLRSKIWRGSGAINYTAQVQISTPILASRDSVVSKEIVSAFAMESAPFLQQLLTSLKITEPEIIENTDSNNVSEEALSNGQ